jgi:hypothetical protein
MYSLVGRIRMISSEAVLTSAEKLAEDIIESYKRPPTTFQEFQQSWETSNPWHEFTKACRAERQSILGTLIVLLVANPHAPIAGGIAKTGYQGHFGTSPLSNHA